MADHPCSFCAAAKPPRNGRHTGHELGVFHGPPIVYLCDTCKASIESSGEFVVAYCANCGKLLAYTLSPAATPVALADHFQFADGCPRCGVPPGAPVTLKSLTEWRKEHYA